MRIGRTQQNPPQTARLQVVRSTYTSQSQAKVAWSVTTRAYATPEAAWYTPKLSDPAIARSCFSRVRPIAQYASVESH
ncbi:hypothetical protein GCM10010277_39470 [Streptomyces longisporoflavus]|nr:hypothetical protein GCM10010277_39470 [Streptomyces longisporoflavus]